MVHDHPGTEADWAKPRMQNWDSFKVIRQLLQQLDLFRSGNRPRLPTGAQRSTAIIQDHQGAHQGRRVYRDIDRTTVLCLGCGSQRPRYPDIWLFKANGHRSQFATQPPSVARGDTHRGGCHPCEFQKSSTQATGSHSADDFPYGHTVCTRVSTNTQGLLRAVQRSHHSDGSRAACTNKFGDGYFRSQLVFVAQDKSQI